MTSSEARRGDGEGSGQHPRMANRSLDSSVAEERLAKERAELANALQDARRALRSDADKVRRGLWVVPTVAAGAGFLGALVLRRLFR